MRAPKRRRTRLREDFGKGPALEIHDENESVRIPALVSFPVSKSPSYFQQALFDHADGPSEVILLGDAGENPLQVHPALVDQKHCGYGGRGRSIGTSLSNEPHLEGNSHLDKSF